MVLLEYTFAWSSFFVMVLGGLWLGVLFFFGLVGLAFLFFCFFPQSIFRHQLRPRRSFQRVSADVSFFLSLLASHAVEPALPHDCCRLSMIPGVRYPFVSFSPRSHGQRRLGLRHASFFFFYRPVWIEFLASFFLTPSNPPQSSLGHPGLVSDNTFEGRSKDGFFDN